MRSGLTSKESRDESSPGREEGIDEGLVAVGASVVIVMGNVADALVCFPVAGKEEAVAAKVRVETGTEAGMLGTNFTS